MMNRKKDDDFESTANFTSKDTSGPSKKIDKDTDFDKTNIKVEEENN